MSKHQTTQPGYMSVGELAQKAGISVRTLQYYDQRGILTPSAKSAGGRRLYTQKDMVKLHQILSLKYLGFSLDEIKNRLASLDTPAEVAAALSDHAAAIREKMAAFARALQAIEALQAEVVQMQSVDFKKYADIIVNLQMNNDRYWLIKHLDEETLDYFRHRFDQSSGMNMLDTVTRLYEQAMRLQREGIPPESEQGQHFARAFWAMVTEFTGGDQRRLVKLLEINQLECPDEAWRERQMLANLFIERALDAYFTTLGYDPFAKETT